MLKSINECGLTVFNSSKPLWGGDHRRRAALDKVIKVIKELLVCHDYSLLVMIFVYYTLFIPVCQGVFPIFFGSYEFYFIRKAEGSIASPGGVTDLGLEEEGVGKANDQHDHGKDPRDLEPLGILLAHPLQHHRSDGHKQGQSTEDHLTGEHTAKTDIKSDISGIQPQGDHNVKANFFRLLISEQEHQPQGKHAACGQRHKHNN